MAGLQGVVRRPLEWWVGPRNVSDLIARARQWLAANPVSSYVIVDGAEVHPIWCAVCRASRFHDLLTDKHPAVPDFLICMRCGNGLAVDEEEVLAA